MLASRAVVRFRARPALLAAALALQLASNAVTARQWQLVMGNLRFGGSATFCLGSLFKAAFFNQAVPALGADALRLLDVARRCFRKRDACLWKLPLPRHPVGLALVVHHAGERARLGLSAHRGALVMLSLAAHLLSILSFFALGRAFGLPFGPVAYAVVVPPPMVLSGLPVSIAGWGVREGTLVALFALAGADRGAVLALSLVYGVIAFAASLPGLALFLDARHHGPKHTATR